MADDEGMAPRRPRRRAVRPAGSTAGEAGTAESVAPRVVEQPTAQEDRPAAPVLQKELAPQTPADSEPDAITPTSSSTSRRSVVPTALFVVVVLALVVAGTYLFLGNRASAAADARDERFVQTARQTVLNLTTIHPDSAQEDVDRLLAGASGDFKAEFEGREGPFVEVVKQARVDSNGEIIEAGLESSNDGSADVLVAARAMVQNSDAAEPAPRDFRLRVTVTDDDGVMTASRVEFVP